MPRYKILKTFKGSQDGRFTEEFKEGTEADLSGYLVSCVPADWIKPVGEAAAKAEKSGKGEKAAKE